jgi:hypothetical protein
MCNLLQANGMKATIGCQPQTASSYSNVFIEVSTLRQLLAWTACPIAHRANAELEAEESVTVDADRGFSQVGEDPLGHVAPAVIARAPRWIRNDHAMLQCHDRTIIGPVWRARSRHRHGHRASVDKRNSQSPGPENSAGVRSIRLDSVALPKRRKNSVVAPAESHNAAPGSLGPGALTPTADQASAPLRGRCRSAPRRRWSSRG